MGRGLDREERGGEHNAEAVKSRIGVTCLAAEAGLEHLTGMDGNVAAERSATCMNNFIHLLCRVARRWAGRQSNRNTGFDSSLFPSQIQCSLC